MKWTNLGRLRAFPKLNEKPLILQMRKNLKPESVSYLKQNQGIVSQYLSIPILNPLSTMLPVFTLLLQRLLIWSWVNIALGSELQRTVLRVYSTSVYWAFTLLGTESMGVRPAFMNLKSQVKKESSGKHTIQCLIIYLAKCLEGKEHNFLCLTKQTTNKKQN